MCPSLQNQISSFFPYTHGPAYIYASNFIWPEFQLLFLPEHDHASEYDISFDIYHLCCFAFNFPLSPFVYTCTNLV